jgi:predicted small lipoprotein YifL
MKKVLLALVFALGLVGVVGCGGSSPTAPAGTGKAK